MLVVKTFTLNNRVNILGIASALLLFYTALSDKPWWTLAGGIEGQQTFTVELSPFSIKVEVLGKPVAVPILFYLNMAARLSILLAATTTLMGSILAGKIWSKQLISLKGLLLPIIFLGGLLIGLNLAKSFLGISPPLMGEFTLKYNIPYDGRIISTETTAVATLTQEYLFAIIAGIASTLAKAVHNKIASKNNVAEVGHETMSLVFSRSQ